MNSYLSFLITFLIGTSIVVAGTTLDIEELLNYTKLSVNTANLHQISTALEIYYLDSGKYPDANNGEELIKLLKNEGYIKGEPLDNNIFDYQLKESGQDYVLNI